MARPPSIPTRIFFGFALLSVLLAGLGIASLRMHERTALSLRRLHEGYLPLALTIGEAKVNQAVFVALLDDLSRTAASAPERQWVDIARRARPATLRRAAHRAERLLRLVESAEERDSANRILGRLRWLERLFREADPQIDALLEASREGDLAEVQRTYVALSGLELQAQRTLRELHILLEDRSLQLARSAAEDEARASVVIALTTLLGLALGTLVTWMAHRLLNPLPLLHARVEAVAGGEFSNPLRPVRDDELGRLTQAFERMVEAIATRDRAIRDAAEERERLQRMQAEIVASLRSAVVVVDAGDVLRTVNAAAERVLGLPHDAVGQHVSTLPTLASLAAEAGPIAEVRANASVSVRRAVAVGDRRLDVRASPFSIGEGGVADGVLVVVDDVTEELVTKERLVSSERLAAIGRMAAHVTHEVRNPLSSMALNVELLADEVEPGATEARALLAAIEREIGRLSALTDDYLRLARVPTPRLERTDVGELLRDVASFHELELARASVRLTVEVSPDPLSAEIDPAQLRQVLSNLLRNAREAMPDGGDVLLAAHAHRSELEILVADQGPGIDGAIEGKLFEAFVTTKPRGTGLGLALSQQVIAAHGGSLRAEPRRERGTTFVIALPNARAESMACGPTEGRGSTAA